MLANGIAAAYSLGQAVRCVVSMVRGNVLFSKPLAWIIFSADQVQLICCNLIINILDPFTQYIFMFI